MPIIFMINMPFQKLLIWQKGIELVKIVYQISKSYPKDELYGLTSQSRRSAVSIPSNIAEGSQRTSQKDFANFISIAKGSLAELLTQVIIGKDLQYFSEKEYKILEEKIIELDKMLRSFHLKLTS